MNKKIYTTMIGCLVFFASEIKAQSVCDSISVDSVSLQSANQFYFVIKNESAYGCAYPSLVVTLNANPYLTATTNESYASWLDWAGGANNGMTQFLIPLTQYTPASSVPLNTVFSGTALLGDPNNPNFSCSLPFQFTYGSMTTSGSKDGDAQGIALSLFPNPVKDEMTLDIKSEVRGIAKIEVLNLVGETVMELERMISGVDAVRIETNEGMSAGTYIVRVSVEGIQKSLLLVKQ